MISRVIIPLVAQRLIPANHSFHILLFCPLPFPDYYGVFRTSITKTPGWDAATRLAPGLAVLFL